jgi:hypothetical protein
MTKKIVNNEILDLTADEEIELQNRKNTLSISDFDFAINDLRQRRNNLLAETDWMANSDVTMSEAMTTYRQALRDITNGLTTVAQVEAVEFPEKP